MKQITRLRSDETDTTTGATAAEVAECDGEDANAGTTPVASQGTDELDQDGSTGSVTATLAKTATATSIANPARASGLAPAVAIDIAATSTDPSATTATAVVSD